MKEMHASLASSTAAAVPRRTARRRAWKPPVPPVDDYTATLHVTSASLAEEGLARGVWFEFTEPKGTRRRCRLNWMSPVQGTCVFKDLDHNRSFAISLDDVRDAAAPAPPCSSTVPASRNPRSTAPSRTSQNLRAEAVSMADLILVQRDGAIATVVLNRPEKFNALTRPMWKRLGELSLDLSADDALRC